MKKMMFALIVAFLVSFSASALAISVSDFDGDWVAETVYFEGVALSADAYGFDMDVSIATTDMGAIVEVKSTAMEMDTRDIFEFSNEELVLEGTSRFVYADETHIHLYIDADGDSTYIVLKREKVDSQQKLTPEQTPIPVVISESAWNIVVTGTDKVVVSDWALIESKFSNDMVLALTNVSADDIPYIEIQVIFYDAEGHIIATETDGHDAVLSGSTVVTSKRVDEAALGYSSVEVVVDTEKYSNSYVNHANSLEINSDLSGDNIFLQVTNNAEKMISEIEIVVVYYKNGVIVGADEDETYDLDVGKKHIFEFNGFKACDADEYKYFVNQAHTWW